MSIFSGISIIIIKLKELSDSVIFAESYIGARVGFNRNANLGAAVTYSD